MKVKNLRTNKTQDDIFEAKNLKEKSVGLLNKEISAVFFQTRLGIHSFGLNTQILVIVFDQKKIVRKIKILHPNRIFFWNPKYNNVLEIRSENIKLGSVKKEDKFKFY